MSVEELISLKNKLDNGIPKKGWIDSLVYWYMLKSDRLSSSWNDRSCNDKKVLNGNVFVETLLPYSVTDYDSNNSKACFVDPSSVLAGSYYEKQKISKQQEEDLMDALDNHTNNQKGEAAHYIKIGNFEIYVASEGKNRVALYRKHNRKIRALVTNTHYPEKDKLRLVRLIPFGSYGLEYVGEGDIPKNRTLTSLLLSANIAVLAFDEAVGFYTDYEVKKGKPKLSFFAPIRARMARLRVYHSFYHR